MNEETLRFLPTGLLIGVENIDLQHAALFHRMILLKESFLDNGRLLASEAEAMIQALREHYATEEQLAGEIGMDFSAHTAGHRDMLQMISKALNDGVEGRADVTGTLRYIEYWFERHIAQDDKPLGECVRRQAIRSGEKL